MAGDRLHLKPEDRPDLGVRDEDDGDDDAIALEIKDLAAIESQVLMLNGHLGESRQATREALGRLESPKIRRLLHRSLRAQDDALKLGLAIVAQTREL